MSGFRKAKAEQAALKIALYGPPGSGKTFTALLLAEGLAKRDGKRIAFVDTERGTDFYCKPVRERAVHPEEFDFDAIYTRSLMEVLKEVRSLDPAHHSVIVIDSITHLWEAARAAYAGKQTKIGTIPMQAWGAIKKPYKDLLGTLLSSPMHVFILGRQGTEYATDEETDELKSVGLKMKAEGETAYEPHILLRMEAVKPRKTQALATIVAYAEKDRTGILSGRSFANPTFDTICGPLLGLLGGTQAQMKSGDETASEDAEAIERGEREFAAGSERLLRQYTAKIDLAESMESLKMVGDELTPALKAKMLPHDLAAVRERYGRRMREVPGEAAKLAKHAIERARPPDAEVITDEMIARAEQEKAALADPTGEKAGELLAQRLEERGKRVMGLI
jgi:hypothetical protein